MPTSGLCFPARFDPEVWEEDLARTTQAGRTAAERARRAYERIGVPRSDLRPCNAEGPLGTALPRCLKVYLPPPAGRFGMVFRAIQVERRLRLELLAFGVRHHPPDSNALTVYQLAHQRLHRPLDTPQR
jgi:hypothetical protein